jgi:capsular exopolysaccharide synthesis family protein
LSLTDYLRIFGRFWWLVALCAVLGAVVGYGASVINLGIIDFTPKYQSTATLFVATQTGTTTAEAYQNDLFSQQRTASYAALATSDAVAARAVDELEAPISPADLQSKISAEAIPRTVMVNVSVTDSSPAKAQEYAAAVANQLEGLVAELETSRRGGTPAAAAVIVDDANYPTEPAGLAPWMRMALGAAAGLIIGLLLALLFGAFDKRLRGRENIESTTGSLVMGGLPKDPGRHKTDAVDLDSDSLYAERLRELRTNLRFTMLPDNSGPPRCIAVTSPAAGDGRTTTAIDLAAALAESGRSVLLVDGDLRQPTLAERLSLTDTARKTAAQRGLSTALVGEDDLDDVIVEVEVGGHAIALLPAGPQPLRPGELWATDRAAGLIERLSETFDYVVIDTPPLGTYTDGAIVGALADGAILLARIGGTTTRSLRRAVETLELANVALLGTVVTFEPASRLSKRSHRKERRRPEADDRAADSIERSGEGAETTEAGAVRSSLRLGEPVGTPRGEIPDEGQ